MDGVFLPTVVGWYMVIFGLLLVVRHEDVKSVISDVLAHRGQFFVLALMTFVLGLLLVASHNVWVMEWPVAITIFGWMLLIGGVMRLFFREASHNMAQRFIQHSKHLRITGGMFLIFGVYLLLHVYHHIPF